MTSPGSSSGESPSANLPSVDPGRLITCSVAELHPHPSFIRHGLTPTACELSALAKLGELAFREPLTITQEHSILAGYAQWQLACSQGRTTLLCHQHDMTEEEALLWLLQRQQRMAGLNPMCRVLLALELEPWFKQQARNNQQRGGQWKGSSNLTEADRIDVRKKIADAAGVSVGNVSRVKRLLQDGAAEVLQAVREGEISIHCASVWLKNPAKQLDRLALRRVYRGKRGISSVIDALLKQHQSPHKTGEGNLNIRRIGRALAAMNAERVASVLVGEIQVPGEVMLLSTALLRGLESQGELEP